MENEYFSFDPGTNTVRTPIPTKFEHLLKFITKVENFLGLHSQEDITNINNQLDQTMNLMVSNIIQRVIAQLIGQTDKGFVTIKATDDGALHIYPVGGSEDGKTDVKIADGDNAALGALADAAVAVGAAGSVSAKLRLLTTLVNALKTDIVLKTSTNVIGKVQVEGTSQAILSAPINITGAGTANIPDVAPGGSYHICSIIFTVDGDVTVLLRDETDAFSGAMSFGGTDEPRGMTHNFGQFPLKCDAGKKFQITTTGDFAVRGMITYYDA